MLYCYTSDRHRIEVGLGLCLVLLPYWLFIRKPEAEIDLLGYIAEIQIELGPGVMLLLPLVTGTALQGGVMPIQTVLVFGSGCRF